MTEEAGWGGVWAQHCAMKRHFIALSAVRAPNLAMQLATPPEGYDGAVAAGIKKANMDAKMHISTCKRDRTEN